MAGQSLDEKSVAGGIAAFVADPRGLYILDIEIGQEDGPVFRQATLIWIAPPPGDRRYAFLADHSGLRPEAAADADQATWPGR